MKQILFAIAVTALALAPAARPATSEPAAQIGRPVRVVSLSFAHVPFDQVRVAVDNAAEGADLVVLPELFRGDGHPETLDGPTVTAMADLARKHHAYIVCPIDRKDGPRRWNTAVLIDRNGQVVFHYDKIYPYWNEFELSPPPSLGSHAGVYQTDFGRLGIAICFDVNFPAVWQQLADEGAELVVWPSAYSAGTSLQAHAINHHYYIVSSTLMRDCQVYDITGELLLSQESKSINVCRITLDLDRGIYHQNFNLKKRDKLLKEHGDDLMQEKWLPREQWFVLKARRPGVSARAIAHEYGLEELRHYIDRSRLSLDRMRGENYAAGVAQENSTAADSR